MKSAEDWRKELEAHCYSEYGDTPALDAEFANPIILAIQSDARESALREALHYIKLSLPGKLPKRSRPNTKHRLAEIIASLIPEASK